MNTATDLEIYEIELPYGRGVENSRLYRVTLGERIPSILRKTSLLSSSVCAEALTYSGSIGFMDVVQEPFPFLNNDLIQEALFIDNIGIEPQHRMEGHATFLCKRAEEIAKERGLPIVVMDTVVDKTGAINKIARKLNYIFIDDKSNPQAYKIIN